MTAKKAVEIIIKQKIGPPPSPKVSQQPSISTPSSANTTPLSKQNSLRDLPIDSNPAGLPRPPSFSSQASTPNTSAKNVSTPSQGAKPPTKEATPLDSKKVPITPEQKVVVTPSKDEPKVGKAAPAGGLAWKIDVPGKQDGEPIRPQAPQAKQMRPRPAAIAVGNPADRKETNGSDDKKVADSNAKAIPKPNVAVVSVAPTKVVTEHKPAPSEVTELPSPTKRASTPNSVRFRLPEEPQAKEAMDVAEVVAAAAADISLLENNKPRSVSAGGKRPVSSGKAPVVSNKLSNYGQVKVFLSFVKFLLFLIVR